MPAVNIGSIICSLQPRARATHVCSCFSAGPHLMILQPELIATNGHEMPRLLYKDESYIENPNKVIGPRKKGQEKGIETNIDDKFRQDLNIQAEKPPTKKFKLSKRMCQDLEYYIDKYSGDFESMARDKRNIYQDSPGQMRYKILKLNRLKSINSR